MRDQILYGLAGYGGGRVIRELVSWARWRLYRFQRAADGRGRHRAVPEVAQGASGRLRGSEAFEGG